MTMAHDDDVWARNVCFEFFFFCSICFMRVNFATITFLKAMEKRKNERKILTFSFELKILFEC